MTVVRIRSNMSFNLCFLYDVLSRGRVKIKIPSKGKNVSSYIIVYVCV